MKKIFKKSDKNIIFIMACILTVHAVIWLFTGTSPFSENPYNSYMLQAQSWKNGSLDLGVNYEHLEIAVFNGKYFISFPPFPSMVYFPFVLFGIPLSEGLIALLFAFAGGIFTYKIFKSQNIADNVSILLTVLCVCGSNLLFVSTNAWVWFIAQNMCFALTAGAIYYAIKNKGGISFTLLACAVGCRPFQILYFPVICMILMNQNDRSIKVFFRKYYWFAGAALIGIFYMWLNYMRFGNVFEFGHNYLPEFTESKYGQFNIKYLKNNLLSLIRLPEFNADGTMVFPQFDGINIFLVSPVFALMLYSFFRDIKNGCLIKTAAILTILTEIICITMHKTMGGWHFGNRYINDCLPMAILILSLSYKNNTVSKPLIIVTIAGVLINTAGTVACYLS